MLYLISKGKLVKQQGCLLIFTVMNTFLVKYIHTYIYCFFSLSAVKLYTSNDEIKRQGYKGQL